MLDKSSYEYAVVRVVPRVDREEFINVGVIVFCRVLKFLDCRIECDSVRLQNLLPTIDLAEVSEHLELIPRICKGGASAGPIGALEQFERFHWLVAPRSAVIQTSATHSGITKEPARVLEHLMTKLVR